MPSVTWSMISLGNVIPSAWAVLRFTLYWTTARYRRPWTSALEAATAAAHTPPAVPGPGRRHPPPGAGGSGGSPDSPSTGPFPAATHRRRSLSTEYGQG